MAKKTTKEELEAQSDDELIVDAKALYESIYIVECYGTKDIFLLKFMYTELERRGYEVRVEERLVITKKK